MRKYYWARHAERVEYRKGRFAIRAVHSLVYTENECDEAALKQRLGGSTPISEEYAIKLAGKEQLRREAKYNPFFVYEFIIPAYLYGFPVSCLDFNHFRFNGPILERY